VQPTTTPADFAALIRRAGITPSDAQTAELYEGWAYIERMLARLRGPGPRPREAEPAHIFVPEATDPETNR
jgi:hypothetical protein